MEFRITTDYIKLDSFLKGACLVGSGGEAKILIADAQVEVNGTVEMRRGRKLYPGDRIVFGGEEYCIGRDPGDAS